MRVQLSIISSCKISVVPMTSSLIVCILVLHVTRSSLADSCIVANSKNDLSVSRDTVRCSTASLSDRGFEQALQDAVKLVNTTRNAEATKSTDVGCMSLLIENNVFECVEQLPNISALFCSVSLKNNKLVRSNNAPFRHMLSLEKLDLSYNSFTGAALTKNIFKCQGSDSVASPIQQLNLAGNRIRYLRFDVFEFLQDLTHLDLSHNLISVFDAQTQKAFNALEKLQILNLANNRLKSLPKSVTLTLPLREFYLNGNSFVEVPAKNFSEETFFSLCYLNINDNPIKRIGANEFKGLYDLQELHVNGMPNLSAIDEDAFSDLISLEALHCSYNPNLEFIHWKAFYGLKFHGKLKELYLNNNNLTSISEESLPWTDLIAFDVSENPWNCDCSLKWLLDFIVKRQSHDPEANFGVRCAYPSQLKHKTFTDAIFSVNCSQQQSDPPPKTSIFYHVINVTFCLSVIALIGYITYFVITRARGPMTSLRSIVVSSAKYKRVRPTILTNTDDEE